MITSPSLSTSWICPCWYCYLTSFVPSSLVLTALKSSCSTVNLSRINWDIESCVAWPLIAAMAVVLTTGLNVNKTPLTFNTITLELSTVSTLSNKFLIQISLLWGQNEREKYIFEANLACLKTTLTDAFLLKFKWKGYHAGKSCKLKWMTNLEITKIKPSKMSRG